MDRIKIDLERLGAMAKDSEAGTKDFFAKLRKKKPKHLDSIVHALHREVFDGLDCLECANCCKNISPIVKEKDVERLAKQLRVKPSELIERYLEPDQEHGYVFRETPCPFLAPDNYCAVYENRPKACREYPHTDRKRFCGILELTLKNTYYCPAVYEVVSRLKKKKSKL